MRRKIIAVSFILVLTIPVLAIVPPFKIGSMVVPPGKTMSGRLDVPEKDGIGTFIPVTVIHGANPGKVLTLVAGTHGSEYPPILALQRLRETIDPNNLAGTVLLVHNANLPSFQKRTVYFTPTDGKNLNRVFPGDPNGTLAQRIAYVITEQIIKPSDVLIDMHCGDANEALIPYSYWMISGHPALDEQTKQVCLAFGLKHIIIDTSRGKDLKDSKFLGNTALLMGKPAVTTESGYLGRSDEEDIVRNVKGAGSVMRHLGMVAGRPDPVPNPVWIDQYEVVNSGKDGLFFPAVSMGAMVRAGQTVGIVKDYWGNVLEEIKSPLTGIMLYILGTPPANAGEPLFEVGRIKADSVRSQ